jgi:hypothetical protein
MPSNSSTNRRPYMLPLVTSCNVCGRLFTPTLGTSNPSNMRYCSKDCRYYHRRSGHRALESIRFWNKVQKSDGCWTWTGSLTVSGYGRLKFRGAYSQAHRVSWTMEYGPIPKGLLVCHRCDNPPCCRPDHLFLGTKSDNAKDMVSKGRYMTATNNPATRAPDRVPRGSRNSLARLTEDDVRRIRALPETYHCHARIGREFGVSPSTIIRIFRRESWKHVE